MQYKAVKASSRVYKTYYEAHKNDADVQLTIKYLPYILRFVSDLVKKSNGTYQYEDALTVALTASVQAEKAYDSTKGCFSTYIRERISGAITDAFRTVPKRSKVLHNQISKYIINYVNTHGYYPTESILKHDLDISDIRYKNYCNTDLAPRFVDIDNTDCLSPASDSGIFMDSVKKLILTLPVKASSVLIPHLIDGVEIKDVAYLLGISVKDVKAVLNLYLPNLRQLMIDNDLTEDGYNRDNKSL